MECGADTCYNVEGPWKYYIKWRKPITNNTSHIIPFTWNVQKRQIHKDEKVEYWFPRARVKRGNGEREVTIKGMVVFYEIFFMKMFPN